MTDRVMALAGWVVIHPRVFSPDVETGFVWQAVDDVDAGVSDGRHAGAAGLGCQAYEIVV